VKKNLLWLFGCLFVLTSCSGIQVTGNDRLPPGQEKKIYGDKSAKAYAPGQNKNKGNKPGGI
jgi:hypothetical protein